MKTYIYEIVRSGCCEEPKYYEIEQAEEDAPLAKHPETGEAIRRVIVGGKPLAKEPGDRCCGGGSDCC